MAKSRLVHGVMGAIVATSTSALAVEIVPESRDSNIVLTFANLGFSPGYKGGGSHLMMICSRRGSCTTGPMALIV